MSNSHNRVLTTMVLLSMFGIIAYAGHGAAPVLCKMSTSRTPRCP
jgi:hypothetical protein